MPRRLLAAFAVITVLVGLSACGRDTPPVPGTDTVSSESRAEPLALSGTTLDGDTLDLADLRGRVVVLNNWASWCVPCQEETPAFVSLSETSDPADVVVVGMNITDEAAAARTFVDDFGVPYPSIVDPDGALIATIPGIPPRSLPSTVILDREGRIAARIIGATDSLELASLISDVLQEGPSPV